MDELEGHPELWTSDFHSGVVARARAELAALEGRPEAAVTAMRSAIRIWHAARARLIQAACRFRLAQMLAEEGDAAGALLEVDAAEAAFATMQAPSRVRACVRLREGLRPMSLPAA